MDRPVKSLVGEKALSFKTSLTYESISSKPFLMSHEHFTDHKFLNISSVTPVEEKKY